MDMNDGVSPRGFDYENSSPIKNEKSPGINENPFTRTDNNAFSRMSNFVN